MVTILSVVIAVIVAVGAWWLFTRAVNEELTALRPDVDAEKETRR